MAISPDGRFAYVADKGAETVDIYSRATNGALTADGCVVDTDATADQPQCGSAARAIGAPAGLALSPDGSSLYVVSPTSGGELARFDVDPATGALSQPAGAAGCASADGTDGESAPGACMAAGGLQGATGVTVSPDEQTVYVAAAGATVLGRDPDGSLTVPSGTAACHAAVGNTLGCTEDRGAPDAFTAVAGDDGSFYGAGGPALLSWARTTSAVTAYGFPAPGGRGSVHASSTTDGASCHADMCTVSSGGTVKLTAVPASGFLFSGWSGACAGQAATCTLSNVTATEPSSAVFEPPVPVIVTKPVIQGTPQLWSDATVTTGAWTNAPTSYSYVWEICDAQGNNCTDTQTTVSDRILTRDFTAKTARVRVTAHNDGGDSAAVTSDPTPVIFGAPEAKIDTAGLAARSGTITVDVTPSGGTTTVTATLKADDGSTGTVSSSTVPGSAPTTTVSLNATNLLPATTYHLTVTATNAYGSAPLPEDPCCLTKDVTTKTDSAVTTAEPTSIGGTSATLVGVFDPVFFVETQTQDCAGGSGNGFGNCGLQAACQAWTPQCSPYYTAYQEADFQFRLAQGDQTITDIKAASASPLGGSIPGSAGQGGQDPYTGLYMDYAAFTGYAQAIDLNPGVSYQFRAHYAASCLPLAYASCDPSSSGQEVKNLYGDWRTFITSTVQSSSTGSYKNGVLTFGLGCLTATGCFGTGAATTILDLGGLGPVTQGTSNVLEFVRHAGAATVKSHTTAKRTAKAVTLGTFRFRIKRGKRAMIHIKVSKAGRAYLKHHRKTYIRLTIAVHSGKKTIRSNTPLHLS